MNVIKNAFVSVLRFVCISTLAVGLAAFAPGCSRDASVLAPDSWSPTTGENPRSDSWVEPIPPQPVPSRDEQLRSREMFRKTFAQELKDQSAAGRDTLAKALLKAALKKDTRGVDQFVLLVAAIQAGREAGDLGVCALAVMHLTKHFEVNGLPIKVDFVMTHHFENDSEQVEERNALEAVGVIQALLNARDYATCDAILARLTPIPTKSVMLPKILRLFKERVATLHAAHDQISADFDKLSKAPADTAANLAVGRFTCFMEGRWEKGLPYLAKGADAQLKSLAQLEVPRSSSPVTARKLADGWWDVSTHLPQFPAVEVEQHAADIYLACMGYLPAGTERDFVQKRLDKARLDRRVPEKY